MYAHLHEGIAHKVKNSNNNKKTLKKTETEGQRIVKTFKNTERGILLPECTGLLLHGIQHSHSSPLSPAYHEPYEPMYPSNFDSH
jgi:hypothetical protein